MIHFSRNISLARDGIVVRTQYNTISIKHLAAEAASVYAGAKEYRKLLKLLPSVYISLLLLVVIMRKIQMYFATIIKLEQIQRMNAIEGTPAILELFYY